MKMDSKDYYLKDWLDEIQSVGLGVGGISIKETSKYPSLLVSAHTDPILRLWDLNNLKKPINRLFNN